MSLTEQNKIPLTKLSHIQYHEDKTLNSAHYQYTTLKFDPINEKSFIHPLDQLK
mgnify:CR=1 FL=1